MRNLILTALSGLVLAVGFTNCSKGFEVKDAAAVLSSAGGADTQGTPTTTTLPSAVSGVDSPMPSDFSANSLKVCPSGCTYSKPSQAVAVAKDGDVIEIKGGDYVDCVSIHQSQMILRGVGSARPHLHSLLCEDKGIVTNYGSKNRFENLELSDFQNGSYNGAAIRQDVAAKDVVLRNLDIHDGQMGVLGGSDKDRIWIVDSKFHEVGFERPDGEISVPVYMTAGDLLVIRNTSILTPLGGASLLKIRPLETIVDCSTLANLESPDSYTIDYQTGGKLSVLNSVLEQSNTTINSTLLAVNTVGYSSSIVNSLTLKGNVFLNDANRGIVIHYYNQAPSSSTVEGNTFVGSGTLFTPDYTPNAGNQVLASRTAAMGVYPSLPRPGACTSALPPF